MQPLLTELCAIWADSAVGARGDQHSHAIIKESDPSATLRSVRLDGKVGEWLLVLPDYGRGRSKKNRIMSPLLSTAKGLHHHRACDAVLIKLREADVLAVFLDLKSGKTNGVTTQFLSTRAFFSYVASLFELLHGRRLELNARYVVLQSPGTGRMLLNKQPTRPQRVSLSDDASNPTIIPVSDGQAIPMSLLISDSDR